MLTPERCRLAACGAQADLPVLAGDTGGLLWQALPEASGDESVLRPVKAPFSATGGLKLLSGNLGRAVIKVSAVPEDRHVIEAPAVVFDTQDSLQEAFKSGQLERDFIAVVRFQGPRANGMPELHKLTPPLAVLQGKGYRVALVTDGRMSGASGKFPPPSTSAPRPWPAVPWPRCAPAICCGWNAEAGTLQALVGEQEWAAREVAVRSAELAHAHGAGLGRELFAGMRRNVNAAEEGACTWL